MITESPYSLWQLFLAGNTRFPPESLAAHITDSFIQQLDTDSQHDFSTIGILCEMALFKKDAKVRQAAVFSLYKKIIEPLCDDFTTSGTETCNLVLTSMLQFISTKAEGHNLANLLKDQHCSDLKHLLARRTSLTNNPPIDDATKKKVKKIIILSRVSVGADIAITSIMGQRLSKAFPHANILIIGPSHIPEIFYGLPQIQWGKFDYQRNGGIAERLNCGANLFALIKSECGVYDSGQVLLFDPDSRLSQLGLLPLYEVKYCYYFSSRNDTPRQNVRISQLTNSWLNYLLDEEENSPPNVSIRPSHLADIRSFWGQFLPKTKKIVINFGVGNDPQKRLSDPFEEQLLYTLLQQKDTLIILDSGLHPDEGKRAQVLMKKMKSRGIPTIAVSGKHLPSQIISFQHGLVCVQVGIGTLSALIDQADVFFGYDSCCQHIATARDTNNVICFAGAPNDRFFERWRPVNKSGQTTTIRIPSDFDHTPSNLSHLVTTFSNLLLG